jgi:hypothetical protein
MLTLKWKSKYVLETVQKYTLKNLASKVLLKVLIPGVKIQFHHSTANCIVGGRVTGQSRTPARNEYFTAPQYTNHV